MSTKTGIYEVSYNAKISYTSVLTFNYTMIPSINDICSSNWCKNNQFMNKYQGVIKKILNEIITKYKVDTYTHIIFRNDVGFAIVFKNQDREYTLYGKRLIVDLDFILNQNKWQYCNLYWLTLIAVGSVTMILSYFNS